MKLAVKDSLYKFSPMKVVPFTSISSIILVLRLMKTAFCGHKSFHFQRPWSKVPIKNLYCSYWTTNLAYRTGSLLLGTLTSLTSYHTDLPGSSHIKMCFPKQMSKLEATCTERLMKKSHVLYTLSIIIQDFFGDEGHATYMLLLEFNPNLLAQTLLDI